MQEDICPHCNLPFRILSVRFGLTGARLVSTCPNCGLAQADLHHRSRPGAFQESNDYAAPFARRIRPHRSRAAASKVASKQAQRSL